MDIDAYTKRRLDGDNDYEISTQVTGPRSERIRVAVVIATAGRPGAAQDPVDAVYAMREHLEERGVTCIGFLSAPTERDVQGMQLPPGWSALLGVRGAALQRNVALDALPDDVDFVFFFDDDAIPRRDYVSTAIRVFDEHRDVVGLTGTVIADGAPSQREIPVAEALRLLENSISAQPLGVLGAVDLTHKELYGCNFAVRWSALRALRFDARLPLYSWLEDHDYACRARRLGSLARVEGCVAVHRGSASGGRTSHRRFGYSQIANPVYLWQKGSFGLRLAMREAMRPGLKNLVLSLLPTAAGRLRRDRLAGNLLALKDILRANGRADPEGMLKINPGAAEGL